jgi:hypothetical protein
MVSISITVTTPERKFGNKGWLDEIARTQRQTAVPRLKKLFQKTVFGWSEKPDFGWVQQRTADTISITMYPQGQAANIWNLVNAGSPRHRIPKSGTTFMKFRPGYRAATTPGSLMSRRAYRSGKYETHFVVSHPGFEPRDFISQIASEYENPFMGDMQEAISSVARK